MALGRLLYGLLLLQATAIRAVYVPTDLADGLYLIPFDNDGNAIGEPVLLPPADATPGQSLNRRQNPPSLPQSTTKCGNRGNININDFQVAKAQLQSECDKGQQYGPNTAIVHTSGTGMAWFCNYQSANRCWRQEYEEAMLRIVAQCGTGKGGEVFVPQYNKAYGGDNLGNNICL
jgi:hypothetical protein